MLTDLGEVAAQFASSQTMTAYTAERNARILDRLAEEIARRRQLCAQRADRASS